MSSTPNSSAARRIWEEAFPVCDTAALATIIAPESLDHSARPGEAQGLEGTIATMRWLASVFSEQRWEIQHVVEDGDLVVVHAIHHGRHTGPMMGLPPTGREVAYEHIHMLRFRDGMAVEHWGIHDTPTLMRQLGVNAPAAAAG